MQAPSKAVARVNSTARASHDMRYGGTSHDHPSRFPAPRVWMTTRPRSGEPISRATFPWRIRKNRSAGSPSWKSRAPPGKRTLDPHPAINWRSSCGRSRKNACPASTASSVCILRLLRGRGRGLLLALADRADFLGDIDRHGTPCDAAAAADTTGCSKLIDPGCQLVGHPLAVSRPRRAPNVPSVDIREIHREAGVPFPPPLGMLTLEVGRILHGAAEAGGAHHRAVGAGQTAPGDVVPARMIVVAIEQILDAGGVHRPAHLARRTGHRLLRRYQIFRSRLPARHLYQDLGAAFRPDLDQKLVAAAFQGFGQRQVEPERGLGPRLHRHAEAGPSRLSAVDRDNDRSFSSGLISGVHMLPVEEHPILDRDGVQLAGANADERKLGWLLAILRDLKPAIARAVGLPQPRGGRKQKLLPRVGTHSVAKQGPVGPGLEAVGPPILLVGPPRGEIGGRPDLVVNDRAIPHGGAHQPVVSATKGREERLETVRGKD